jgi:hypothetical protein
MNEVFLDWLNRSRTAQQELYVSMRSQDQVFRLAHAQALDAAHAQTTLVEEKSTP